jgi:hypothetical protein
MYNLIESIEYRGCSINIYPDDNPESPRQWDNIGTILCFHKRYELGDRHNVTSDMFRGWNEVYTYLEKEEKAAVILPLYLYDHSGLRIKVGSFRGLLPQGHVEFDSGQVGFIYVSAEKIRSEYNVKYITKKIREKVISCLENEVEVYDNYLSGSVYGYITIDQDGETIDSCFGFFGNDTKYMIDCAKESIDYHIKRSRKKHYDKLKQQIKSNVPLDYRTSLVI